jgi:hypothetical protein
MLNFLYPKLKKNRPYIIIGAFVLGMLLTPPDIISQTLIAVRKEGIKQESLLKDYCRFFKK